MTKPVKTIIKVLKKKVLVGFFELFGIPYSSALKSLCESLSNYQQTFP